ncbi:hypothetical protein C8R46DRAFT_1268412 [Mycena filopes]|nr:hypothetical protein C8R46DRAFT_1268412 [Mycena filopes]
MEADTLITRLRQILLATDNTFTAGDKESVTARGFNHQSDADLLRNHHAKMAQRVAAIDLEMHVLDARRLEIQGGGDGELARLRALVSELADQYYTRIQTANEVQQSWVMQLRDKARRQNWLEDLETERAALVQKRAVHSHIITPEAFQSAPFRRVPNEILLKIFMAATAGELEPVGTGSAFILAQVPLSVVVDATVLNHSVPASNMDILATHADNIVHLLFLGLGSQFIPAWRPDGALAVPRLHTLALARSTDLLDLKHKIQIAGIRALHFSESTSGYQLGSFKNLAEMTPPPLRSLATWRVELPVVHGSSVLPSHTINFFGRFRTPALRTLHIRRLSSAEGLLDLLRRSECALSTLVLEEPLIASPDILAICAATPTLETLAITSGGVGDLEDDFFAALTLDYVLPRLTEFRVEGSYRFSTEALLEMVESRTAVSSGTIARLRKVDLDLPDRVLSLETIRTLLNIAGVVFNIPDKSGVRLA